MFDATSLVLKGSLKVVNGVGEDYTLVRNLKIEGNVKINNGSGGAFTGLQTLNATAGFTDGAGADVTQIYDTNVCGNITVNNGAADRSYAGYFDLANSCQRCVAPSSAATSYARARDHPGTLEDRRHRDQSRLNWPVIQPYWPQGRAEPGHRPAQSERLGLGGVQPDCQRPNEDHLTL